MTEPIKLINDEIKNCEVLFECNSVDALASYKMIREGVEITPDNTPVFNHFDIKLIAEPRSPYGFSSLFKRNKNIDEWEYMGFGHSGACSVVTALLKQLQRKIKQNDELIEVTQKQKEKIKNLNYALYEDGELTLDIGKANLKIASLEREIFSRKNRFSNELKILREQLQRKTAECEKLQKSIEEKNNFLNTLGISASGEFHRIKYYVDNLNKKYNDLREKLDKIEDIVIPINNELPEDNVIREIALILNDCVGLPPSRYKQALDEIEKIAQKGLNPICYKSNCSRCQCYEGDDCNARMNALINNYFTENGEFFDGNGDFIEAMEDLLDKERSNCNRAIPISKQILDIISKAKGEENANI